MLCITLCIAHMFLWEVIGPLTRPATEWPPSRHPNGRHWHPIAYALCPSPSLCPSLSIPMPFPIPHPISHASYSCLMRVATRAKPPRTREVAEQREGGGGCTSVRAMGGRDRCGRRGMDIGGCYYCRQRLPHFRPRARLSRRRMPHLCRVLPWKQGIFSSSFILHHYLFYFTTFPTPLNRYLDEIH